MLKKEITFKDLDDNPVTDTFYFSLSIDKLTEMYAAELGGFEARMQKVIDTQDIGQIMFEFRRLIRESVGFRSDDGRRFVQTPQFSEEFLQTDAYQVLMWELLTDATEGANFMKSILPKDLLAKAQLEQGMIDVNLPAIEAKPREKDFNEYTLTELGELPFKEFDALINKQDLGSLRKDVMVMVMQRRAKRK